MSEESGLEPFDLERGEYGTRMVLHSAWKTDYMEIIERAGVEEIELNSGKFWPGGKLSFLREIPSLRALLILDLFQTDDVSPVQNLHELRLIELGVYSKSKVDFRNFPHLRQCLLEWNTGFASALEVKGLQRLVVNRLPKLKAPLVGNLKQLRDLGILSCSAESLDFLCGLAKLQHLRLALMRKLKGSEFVSSLGNLKTLWIQSCSGFESLEHLRGAKNLERVWIDGTKEIESLAPLADSLEIREIAVSRVRDSEVSKILALPKLERLYVRGLGEWKRRPA